MAHTHVDGSYSKENPTLWGVFFRGIDEWKAVASQKEAMDHANLVNAKFAEHMPREFDPHLWAIPDLWPFSAEDHARDIQF